jgi:hypothetical protein
MAIPQPADEQGLREAVLDGRSVRLRGHDAAHGEAVGRRLGLFGQSPQAARRMEELGLRLRLGLVLYTTIHNS